ncbi:MAG: cysteine desulfurase [Planctomycetes bacterium]|nr:cysteine desulfurase [Planctomycetota bacterium]
MKPIYLDYNATAPMLPEVAQAMERVHCNTPGNPASLHAAGRHARKLLENARDDIAEMLGARLSGPQADRLFFTSGAAEANNLALFGLAGETPGQIVISAIEHPSIALPAAELSRRGWQVDRLPVTGDGVVQVDRLDALLSPDTRLVSVMLANNETGVLQPVGEVAAVCRAKCVPIHTDAAQAVGKLPVDFRGLGVQAMSVSAHKLHGPVGIGALIVRGDVSLAPLMHGGHQQSGLRPGTESVALVVGMQKALWLWRQEADWRAAKMTQLRDRFEGRLTSQMPNIVIHGQRASRLPNTTCVSLRGLDRQMLLIALDQAGVACSTGSACASGSTDPSPTLVAMGLEKGLLDSALRFSLGAGTNTAEVDLVAGHICRIYSEIRVGNKASKNSSAPRKLPSKPL